MQPSDFDLVTQTGRYKPNATGLANFVVEGERYWLHIAIVWPHHADRIKHIVESSDIEEALRAAGAIGGDVELGGGCNIAIGAILNDLFVKLDGLFHGGEIRNGVPKLEPFAGEEPIGDDKLERQTHGYVVPDSFHLRHFRATGPLVPKRL